MKWLLKAHGQVYTEVGKLLNERKNGRLETMNATGSPKSENTIHVRKTAGIGPRSASVMDKVNNWFRKNSAANSPLPGTSNRHECWSR